MKTFSNSGRSREKKVQQKNHKHDGEGGEDNETDDEEEHELCEGVTASCGPFKYPARSREF